MAIGFIVMIPGRTQEAGAVPIERLARDRPNRRGDSSSRLRSRRAAITKEAIKVVALSSSGRHLAEVVSVARAPDE